MEISDVRANDHHICIFRCWLCWGVIDPIGSVFNLDMFSLFLVNKELLSSCVLVNNILGDMCLTSTACEQYSWWCVLVNRRDMSGGAEDAGPTVDQSCFTCILPCFGLLPV